MSEPADPPKIPKPDPRPAPESLPYWESAKAGRLELPRCEACHQHWFPPSRTCPHCLSANVAWSEVSGRGKVFSYVIYDRVYHPAFEGEVPYVVALIELEEGPRLLSNVIGIAPLDVRCDMPVKVVFERRASGASVPMFAPA